LNNNRAIQALGGNSNDGIRGQHRTCYGGNGVDGYVNFLKVLQ